MWAGIFPDTDAKWQRMSHAYAGLFWASETGCWCKLLIEHKQSPGIIWETAIWCGEMPDTTLAIKSQTLRIYQDLLAVLKSLQHFIFSLVHHPKSSASSSTSERTSQLKARVMWPCKFTDLYSRNYFAFLYYLSSSESPKSISIATGSCCVLFVLPYIMDRCS